MILLDTNIVSEVMRPHPSVKVLNWLNTCNLKDLFISSITIAEISYGLHILPKGQRQQLLQSRFEQFIAQGFSGNILVFDEQATYVYAEIMAAWKSNGHPMSLPDGQIAAIAKVNQFTLATDFIGCGIQLTNPFSE